MSNHKIVLLLIMRPDPIGQVIDSFVDILFENQHFH